MRGIGPSRLFARLWAAAVALVLVCAGEAVAGPNCTFKTVTSVAFGIYDVLGVTPISATGTIQIKCTGNPGAWTLTLSRGNAPSYTPRFMLLGAEHLDHNLYTDAGATQIWGDGTGGTTFVSGSGNGTFTFTIYGLLPAGQDVGPGTYTDTITATLTF